MDPRITPDLVELERRTAHLTHNVEDAWRRYQMAIVSQGVDDATINRRRAAWIRALGALQEHLALHPASAHSISK